MNKKTILNILLFTLLLTSCGNTSSQSSTISNNNSTNTNISSPNSTSSVHTHTYSDKLLYDDTHHWYEVTCEHTEAINKEIHTFKSVVTNPSYENGGYTTYSCESCDYSYIADETEVLNHNYSTQLTYDEHTHWYPCIDEGYEQLKKDEKPHSFKSIVTDPTGTSGGYTTHTCEICNYSYVDNETNPLTYTITWKNYDGSILEIDENVQYGTTPTYNGATPIKPNEVQHSYTWLGWSPSIEPVTSNKTYLATFSDTLINAKISFDLNGGTTTHSTESFYSSTIESENFFFDVKKENYNFRGWSYNGQMVFDHKGNKLSDPSIEETMVFKAEFAQNVILTIYSNIPDAGKINGEGTYEYNTNVDVSVQPNQGYSFVGWYYNDTLLSNQKIYKYMMWSKDITLEARFKINSYNFHVESEQPLLGQVMIKDKTYYKDYSDHNVCYLDSITISAYTKTEEYRFLGWYNSNGELVTTNAVYTFIMTNYDYSLYARWDSPIHNLIITSNNQTDCTITGSGSYRYGSYVTVEIDYSYGTFEGWYDSNDNLMSKNKSYTFLMPNNELHLRAKWAKDLIIENGIIKSCNNNANFVTIPNYVTSIGSYAFENCSSLTTVTFEEGSQLKSIGEDAFFNCSSLESITIPFVGQYANGSGKIHFGYIFGASAYYYNDDYVPSSLKEVIITGGTTISDYAFYNCKSLTSIVIPNSVTSIGDEAFYNCSSLTSIVIPNSVTSIGDEAFYNCSSLTSITIPNSVTSIGSKAFGSCNSLTIYCETESQPSGWDSSWNYLSRPVYWGAISENIIEQNGIRYLIIDGDATVTRYVGNDSEVVIPSSIQINGTTYNVTSIGDEAFYNCSSLTSITIPNSVTSIGSYAFSFCSSLTIYCEASSQPEGWSSSWNYTNCPVYWAGELEYNVNGNPTPII